MTMDPAIHFSLRMALSLLFLTAAIHKLRDGSGFRTALENYHLLPAGTTSIAAAALIVTELSLALALPLYEGSGPAALAAFALAVYAAAIAINLGRGRRIDCGCGGPTGRQPLSRALVARNVSLCAVALVSALPTSERALVWIDAVTIAATVAFLCLTYASLDRLIANSPQLAALGGVEAAQALKPPSPQGPGVGLEEAGI